MRINRFVLLLGLGLLASACSNKTTSVVPAGQALSLSSKGMIYTLPATNLQVSVIAEHRMYVPGPYSQYAKKYLGIDNVPSQGDSEWSMVSFGIDESFVPDMNALFVAELNSENNLGYLSLSSIGLVIPIHKAQFQSGSSLNNPSDSDLYTDLYTDLSHTPFIAAERTTHYSRVFQDSTFVRVPVHKDIIIEKSAEDKAREAANFIFSLRKRRFELISGDADFIAEGRAVKDVFDEISRLEQEYLSLFTGKRFTRKQLHEFNFLPIKQENGGTILFRFSRAKGVLPASDLSGSPVLIEVSSDSNWKNMDILNSLSLEIENKKRNAFYYRIPVPANVKLSDSKGELFTKTANLYQFGPLVRIPSDFNIQNGTLLFDLKK
ncbi:MAG: DUF4831 family protein [Tenuifilaceae bacterium]|nr:DUF4831 family protein [Tenuifilaceae bacterium]